MKRSIVARTIRAYDGWVTRAYCLARFHILRQRFLDEIGQYLPEEGPVLDVGCGFGLFSQYFAQTHSGLEFFGVDINARRIGVARRAAQRLGLRNVSYEVGDARSLVFEGGWGGAYMLDIIHHIPRDAVEPLLRQIHERLRPGSRLLVKDVGRRPFYKRWFTHWLDWLMDPRTPVHYWSSEELLTLLTTVGFTPYCHAMVDYLPYPHLLYVCERP